MTFTTKELFAACAALKKKAGNQVLKEDSYRAIHEALLKWIESQFIIRKGCHLSSFCTLTFKKEKTLKDTVLRPYFQPSDSFIKANILQWRGGGVGNPTQELTSCEDINFAKIAIRFSSNLNKDMVFTGVRLMQAQIGKAMMSGGDVQLDFGVGTLLCREKKIDFQFTPEWNKSRPAPSTSSSAAPAVSEASCSDPGSPVNMRTAGSTPRDSEPTSSPNSNPKPMKPSAMRKPDKGGGGKYPSRDRPSATNLAQVRFEGVKDMTVSDLGAQIPSKGLAILNLDPSKDPGPKKPGLFKGGAQRGSAHVAELVERQANQAPGESPRQAASVADSAHARAKKERDQASQEETKREQEMKDRRSRLEMEAQQLKEKKVQEQRELQNYLKSQIEEKNSNKVKQKQEKKSTVNDPPLFPAESSKRAPIDTVMRREQYKMELKDQMWEKEFDKYMRAEEDRLAQEQHLSQLDERMELEHEQKRQIKLEWSKSKAKAG